MRSIAAMPSGAIGSGEHLGARLRHPIRGAIQDGPIRQPGLLLHTASNHPSGPYSKWQVASRRMMSIFIFTLIRPDISKIFPSMTLGKLFLFGVVCMAF